MAEIGDGKWFVDACSTSALKKVEQASKEKYLSQLGSCNAFVMGIIQGHHATRASYKQPPTFCPPKSTTNFEMTAAVVAMVEAQPSRQNLFVATLAIEGLRALFPCSK